MTSFHTTITALVPKLRERVEAAEAARQVPAETIDDLRAAGLFRSFVPRSFGGEERTPSEVFDAIIEIARACSSSAWVGSLLTTHNWIVALFGERAQAEVWANGPDTLVVSSVAPTGSVTKIDGGFRLKGRWAFVSGVDHGAWVMLTAMFREDAASDDVPRAFLLLVPAGQYVVHDDWHVAGLRATGSKSVALNDVFVPEHRTLPMEALFTGDAPGLSVRASPLYRLPWQTMFDSSFPPVALGTALANIDGFREYTRTRVHAYFGTGFRTSPGHSMRTADATARVDAALALFRHNVAEIERKGDGTLSRGAPIFATRISYECAFVIDQCSRAIYQLFRASGGKALHSSNPLQRHFRDIHAMTQHAAFDLDTLGPKFGQALIDLEGSIATIG